MNQRSELRQRLRQQASKNGRKPIKSPEQTLVHVQIALTLLPLLTACVYLFGMSWHMGYVEFFHVDSSEFPLSTEQNLLTGVAALVVNILPLLTFPIVLFPALFVVGIFSVVTFKSINWIIQASREKIISIMDNDPLLKEVRATLNDSTRNKQPSWLTTLLTAVITWYIRFAYLIVTCGIVLMLAYYSHDNGETVAVRQVKEMKEGTFASTNKLTLANNSGEVSALRIVCNAIQCAFWSEKYGTFYLRHEQIDRMTILPKPNSKEQSPSERAN
ncbi:hypothetical protein QK281_07880 [Aeromonas hydrophila]|uniref:hypothetical protein n=1 Tax=Aeromonas hydrophila TaxID=644 RepID=UPI00249F6577|nr:hypothetical protein [Aeromonas hydrophila]WGY33720.1 hypothetical protein QK281_07880 [Aeromonas hydrophila]HDC4322891.1 hypothetical protein [Aeromonas hydrophila]